MRENETVTADDVVELSHEEIDQVAGGAGDPPARGDIRSF